MDWLEYMQVMLGVRVGRQPTRLVSRLADTVPGPRFRRMLSAEVERRAALER